MAVEEDGQFLGYLQLQGTFDPTSGKLLYQVAVPQLGGTLFLPGLVQPAAVANHAAKELRRRKRRPTAPLEAMHIVADEGVPPDERASKLEESRMTRDLLASLPPRRRAVGNPGSTSRASSAARSAAASAVRARPSSAW